MLTLTYARNLFLITVGQSKQISCSFDVIIITIVIYSEHYVKGHRQHMRIRYHFLADLHVTRHARETESEKRIRNTPNKLCRVELVTSRNCDYRP